MQAIGMSRECCQAGSRRGRIVIQSEVAVGECSHFGFRVSSAVFLLKAESTRQGFLDCGFRMGSYGDTVMAALPLIPVASMISPEIV
jgi:hypothetical protein